MKNEVSVNDCKRRPLRSKKSLLRMIYTEFIEDLSSSLNGNGEMQK